LNLGDDPAHFCCRVTVIGLHLDRHDSDESGRSQQALR
jgi:hypothetical protein